MESDKIRINKFLSMSGICSRREADRAILEGRVLVNSLPSEQGQMVSEEDEILFDGKRVSLKNEDIYLIFNKPMGLVCTTAKFENGVKIRNVVDYINYPERIYPVGRLDKNSEGLLILTNQGNVMNKVLKSRYNHEKEYFVKVNKDISDDDLKRLSKGVRIFDPSKNREVYTKRCKVWRESSDSFHIILTQGLNRQIRRMCETFGFKVVRLRRDRIVNITLGELKPGKYRKLSKEEVAELKRQLNIDE
ncbi:MAG: pseudouridine synthase [Lachnospiraceae bacterium]|nr:pseudouridine synthase [Lachnospiraceae bacterium]